MRETQKHIVSYLQQRLEDDPIYDWISEETTRRGLPAIQITPVQGRLLNLLAQLLNAHYILEVGTLTGYSGVWLARALPPNGKLFTLDINPMCLDMAREAFVRAGVADRVELHLGPALETLMTLEIPEPLDMVLIDADKDGDQAYFDWAVENLRSGGLIAVDNVPIVSPDFPGSNNVRIHAPSVYGFTEHVFLRHENWGTLLPFYRPFGDLMDGLLIYRKP